jgi:hypothetical protein
LVFEKNAKLFAEDFQKWQKIGILKSTPGHLNPAVWQVDPVRSGNVSGRVLMLRLLKVSPGNRILNPVLIAERLKRWRRGRGPIGLRPGKGSGSNKAQKKDL